MADRSHYSVRWRVQETAENCFLESHVWDQEAADGSRAGGCAHCAGNGAGYRQATTPVTGWLCRRRSALGLRLYQEATPKEALLPSHCLLAPLQQRRATAFPGSWDIPAIE